MAAITEDYCSKEIYKLLIEKGFDGEVHTSFDKEGYTQASITLQMAMKWLREYKKILISIFCHIDKGYWFCIQHFIDSPYKFATSESIHRKEEILGKIQYYDTYEQACDAAIKYCLENLI